MSWFSSILGFDTNKYELPPEFAKTWSIPQIKALPDETEEQQKYKQFLLDAMEEIIGDGKEKIKELSEKANAARRFLDIHEPIAAKLKSFDISVLSPFRKVLKYSPIAIVVWLFLRYTKGVLGE